MSFSATDELSAKHATTPSNLTTTLTGFPPGLTADSYRWYYHEGIEAYGVSFAKTVGEWGWAGEASYRTNNPLSALTAARNSRRSSKS